MGKGDIKTRRGKIRNGSFGKSRPHRTAAVVAPTKKKTSKKK
jgi:30S ribosomal protein S31